MDLLEKLLAQLAAVQDVWMPFLLALAIVSVIIWRAIDYAYSTRLTNADSTKDLLERRLAEYQDKLSGATPDEARARMDALEARINALSPRNVSSDQRMKIAQILDALKGSVVEIASDMASPDAHRVGRGLSAAFASAGWSVRAPMVMGIGNIPLSGLGLEVANPASLSDAERTVENAFKAAGLRYDLRRASIATNHPDPADVRLLVTNRVDD